jgi:hypothetical protein
LLRRYGGQPKSGEGGQKSGFSTLPWKLVLASGSPVKINAREPNQAQKFIKTKKER